MSPSRSILQLTCLLAASSALVAQEWSHYQHDSAHTGRTSAAVKPSKLALAWSAPGYTAALVLGDSLYAKSYVGLSTAVSSFAVANGQVNWTWPGEDIYFANMAVAGPFVVLEGFDFGNASTDTLTVLDRATGQLRYKMELPLSFSFLDPTLVRDPATGVVTAFCSDGSVLVSVRIGQDAGQILWTRTGDLGTSSVPTLVGDSVIVVGNQSASAFDQATGDKHVFFVDAAQNLNAGAPVAFHAGRSEFYVKLDYQAESLTRVRAFHYDGNDSIDLLWTRTTPKDQFGGMVAIGPNDNLYVVGSGEIAILSPEDGSTLRSIPFPFVNGCSPALSRRVLWVYSDTQTYAYDSATLGLLRVFEGSPGFNLGWISPGAFVPGTAALNIFGGGGYAVDVYRHGP